VPGCVSLLSLRIDWWDGGTLAFRIKNSKRLYLCTNFRHWATQALFWDGWHGSHVVEVMRFFGNDEFCDFIPVVGGH
jgi:hypothetical protein